MLRQGPRGIRSGTCERESNAAAAMLPNLGAALISSHAALGPLPPGVWTLPVSTAVSSPFCLSHDSITRRSSSSRRRTRPNSAAGPTLLHPSGSGPEGVPSSLFKFQPRTTPKKYPNAGGAGRATVASTPAITEQDALYAGLVEDSDLPDVSALLVDVRPGGTNVFYCCNHQDATIVHVVLVPW